MEVAYIGKHPAISGKKQNKKVAEGTDASEQKQIAKTAIKESRFQGIAEIWLAH
jgi:hypothetical protein